MRISQWVWNVFIWNSLWFQILLLVIKHIKDLLDSHKSGKPFTTKIFAKYSTAAWRLGLLLIPLSPWAPTASFFSVEGMVILCVDLYHLFGLPDGARDKDVTWQSRRHKRQGFSPWVRKIPLEEGTATHSSILGRRIPWTKEPGGLQSTESQRIRQDWSNLAHTVFGL